MQSGMYSEQVWDDQGRPSVGWDPINWPPHRGWQLYRDAFCQITENSRVAMANFIPWGSAEVCEFLVPLELLEDGALLERILRFSDCLNEEITRALKPKLIVVPLSLSEDMIINRVHTIRIARRVAANLRPHVVDLRRRRFNFYTGRSAIGSFSTQVLYLPHPSSLRFFNNQDADSIVNAISEQLTQGA